MNGRVTSLILHEIDGGLGRSGMSKNALEICVFVILFCVLVIVEKTEQCACEGLCTMHDQRDKYRTTTA